MKFFLSKLLSDSVSNKATFNATQITTFYAKYTGLQKPEQTILSLVGETIKNGRMLDIGVGGGRLTHYFAPLVNEYIGIDYAENMVEFCKQQFHSKPPNISFQLCDARDMSIFRDAYFDFVLASFNCIDYVSHTDRIKILNEMKRVSKIGGLVCFSAHNLVSVQDLFKLQLPINPFKVPRTIYRYASLLSLNEGKKQLINKDYAIINDGAHDFGLKTYYIKPIKQIEQIEALEFKNIRIFSLVDGKEVAGRSELSSLKDPWLYYLCTS